MKFLVWAAETLKQITISTGPRETNTSSCCSGNTQLPCYCSLGKGWNISLKWVSKKKDSDSHVEDESKKGMQKRLFRCHFHITSLLYESLSSLGSKNMWKRLEKQTTKYFGEQLGPYHLLVKHLRCSTTSSAVV